MIYSIFLNKMSTPSIWANMQNLWSYMVRSILYVRYVSLFIKSVDSRNHFTFSVLNFTVLGRWVHWIYHRVNVHILFPGWAWYFVSISGFPHTCEASLLHLLVNIKAVWIWKMNEMFLVFLFPMDCGQTNAFETVTNLLMHVIICYTVLIQNL